MTYEIRPLRPTDLEKLSCFLTAGFQTLGDADYAAPDVLAWKYLEPQWGADEGKPCSYIACTDNGAIVGHVGICRTSFHGPGLPTDGIPTVHMIDWLGSPAYPSIGTNLMRRAHQSTPTQFGLGGSRTGRAVIKRTGYKLRESVLVFQRTLRPSYWLHIAGLSKRQRAAHLIHDTYLWSKSLIKFQRRRVNVQLRPTHSFGLEIEPIVTRAAERVILTNRTASRLNHLLRFPRQAISGWYLVVPPNRIVGFALLNVIPQQKGQTHLGKVVDCLLDCTDPAVWYAAFVALTHELARQGSDLTYTFGATAWITEGLLSAGYHTHFGLELSLRDRQSLIPSGIPLHITPIEADYAYT
jgi:hypothetical protein